MTKTSAWKKAELEFEGSFKQYGKRAYVHHFTDTASVITSFGRESKAFVEKQPADYLVAVCCKVFFAEVKSCSHESSFPFSAIRKGQWNASRQVVATGGLYLFFIKRETTGEWYRVPAERFHTHDAKSIKWELLNDYKHELNARHYG